jgi:formylglycine-generating enzyme
MILTIRRFMARAAIVVLWACNGSATREDAPHCAWCPEMVTIPTGTALLGAGDSDVVRNADELPERRVVVSAPFAVSRYEITRGQYEAFVRATNRPVHGGCLTDRVKRGVWVVDSSTNFRDPGFAQGDDHPVACVSWDDAQAYVVWLNTQSSGGYRLLTESEWEYVARAGAVRNTPYPWGGDPDRGCAFANGFDSTARTTYAGVDTVGHKMFDPLRCADEWLNTAPVGSLEANEFGVHDMIGNVSEWVDDCYSPSRETRPTGDVCSRRIAKGGSWGTLAHNLRTAERFPYPATHRDDSIGFRVARSLRAD